MSTDGGYGPFGVYGGDDSSQATVATTDTNQAALTTVYDFDIYDEDTSGLYEGMGATPPASYDGDGSSLMDPNSAGAVPATNLGAVNVTVDPFIQGMYETQNSASQDEDAVPEWRAPDYAPPPSDASVTDLSTVTVGNDGTGGTVTYFPRPNEALPAPTPGSTLEDAQSLARVNAENAQAAQANQNQLVMLHNLYQSTANEAAPYFLGPAILGAAVAAAPLTLPAAVGNSALGGILTGGQLASGIAGGIGGYEANGPWGAIFSATTGILAGGPISQGASAVNYAFGGASGWFAGVAAWAGANGFVGGATTFGFNAANYLAGNSSSSVWNGVWLSAALSATAPILSGEAFLVGLDVGAGVETGFSMYTNTINLAEAYWTSLSTKK